MPTSLDECLVATRATLIERLKNWEDQTSWQIFFETYARLITTVAIRAGLSKHEAQDIVQETILSVAKHMPTFVYDPKMGSFKSWLMNITRWRIIDHLRRKKRASHVQENPDGKADTEFLRQVADPAYQAIDAAWEAEWEQNLLSVAVERVKRQVEPLKFQVFDFYVNKGWVPEKVADTFGIPTDHVYMIKHRMIAQIKAEVQRIENEVADPEFKARSGVS